MNQQETSLLDKVNQGYSNLWKLLIKPNRVEYSIQNLGLQVQYFGSTLYKRHDYQTRNHQGFNLQCSFYEPMRPDKLDGLSSSTGLGNSDYQVHTESLISDSSDLGFSQPRNSSQNVNGGFKGVIVPPCVVYCHSQSGNRTEGMQLLEYCGAKSMSLLVFDFAACGMSEGEYVSLGWFENMDLELVINDARSRFMLDTVTLWGRSMGAVTCILYAERHQSEINMMVLDSPFSNLRDMLIQIGQSKVGMPSMLISLALSMISSTITEKLGANILDLEPGKVAEKCNIPAVFIVAKDDEILPPKSVLDIYTRYGCAKKAIIHSHEGGHGSEREEHIIEQAFSMLTDELAKKFHQESMKRSYIMEQTPRQTGGKIDDPFLRSAREIKGLNNIGGQKTLRILNSHKTCNSNRGLLQHINSYGKPGYSANKENLDQFDHNASQWGSPMLQHQAGQYEMSQIGASNYLLNEYDLGGVYSQNQPHLNSHTTQYYGQASSGNNYLHMAAHQNTGVGLSYMPHTPQKIITPRLDAYSNETGENVLNSSISSHSVNYLPSNPREARSSILNCSLTNSQISFKNSHYGEVQNQCLSESRLGLSNGKPQIRRLGSRLIDNPHQSQN